MKIIAKVDHERVLCECSIEEIALLNGFRNRYASGYSTNMEQVGAELNLIKMANASRNLRNMRKDTLAITKDKLLASINTVDEVMEEISKLELFEILSDEPVIS